jgi:hypothetical protein
MEANNNAPDITGSTVLQEDLELFRRVMRVMNALQKQDASHQNQQCIALPAIRAQPGFSTNLPNSADDNNPTEGEYGLVFEDSESHDDDDDSDDDDDIEEDEDEQQHLHEDGEGESDDYHDYYDDDSDDDDDDDTPDADFFEHQYANYQDGENECGPSQDGTNECGPSHGEELRHPVAKSDSLYHQQPRQNNPTSTLSPPSSSAVENTVENIQDMEMHDRRNGDDANLRCWDHGCNGHKFTNLSNLKRHIRENSSARPACRCDKCGAVFSRTTARNIHVARKSCNRIRRYSNGRIRPNLRIK